MDNYDEQAKELLKMRSLNEAVEAVAAALRELGEENEWLKEQIMSPTMRCPQCDQLRLEIGKLRAQLRG